ncbi:MAG: hypothetical protein IPF51_11325 [Dehalococcoidia bacterium]|uniref:FGLLP motif-containing membrane protein n=1 Tax=Candidatus Amarobacter glycogenicus TaxID=3140699 RepID=UPI003135D3C0|nr:hypothetical protein [Dehalococcoidia bacterium]
MERLRFDRSPVRASLRAVGLAVFVLAFGSVASFGRMETAVAACTGAASADIPFPTVVSPAPIGQTVQGPAPLQVIISLNDSAIESTPITSSLDWNDGSAEQPLAIVSCGDDIYSFPGQQHSHTYTTPGNYAVVWRINAQGLGPIAPLVVFVNVEAAAATPIPATATPAPPTPAATAPNPTATSPAPVETSPAATTAATSEVTPATPPQSPAPTSTSTPVPPVPTQVPSTPTQAAVAAVASARPSDSSRPSVAREVPGPGDVSTDPGVISTNLILAGVTVWVFFSSVLFNQTAQQHREEISGWWRRWTSIARGRKPVARRLKVPRAASMAGVLVATGFIYGFLDPGFGLNRSSAVLFVSVIVGVGLVGLLYSGLEAWSRERTLGSIAEVRAYPLSLAVAVLSVVASRALGLQPGVVYGFAASCVVLGGAAGDERNEGRALAVPVVACLGLSTVCWLLVAPVRALPGAALSDTMEAIAVIVFIGGLEGLLINLMPLDVMDGAKIYRWRRSVWVGLRLVSAFLAWHILLNSQRAYFDSLRTAGSLSVLAAFVVYTAAGVALWAFFAVRQRRSGPAAAT